MKTNNFWEEKIKTNEKKIQDNKETNKTCEEKMCECVENSFTWRLYVKNIFLTLFGFFRAQK